MSSARMPTVVRTKITAAQFVGAVNEGLEKPITKEEYIGMMKTYFPQLKRWRKTLIVSNDEAMNAKAAIKREESDKQIVL